ncbi:MAG: type IV pilin protein [Comamonadaceae bacterium]|nr:type IV pilin protein [Comamonadaceae bacterium]
MSALQQAQERRRANHATYTTTLSDLGWNSSTTPTGLYTVTLAYVSDETKGSGYIVSAVGVDGTSQAQDKDCRKLSVRVVGGNIDYAGCGTCATFSYAASNSCWAR